MSAFRRLSLPCRCRLLPYLRDYINVYIGAVFFLGMQAFEHSVDTAFLLVEIGMDVQIEGCGDIGVPEQDADGLAVATGFDTTRGKTMTQAVELDEGDIQFGQETAVVVAIGARFGGFETIGEDIKLRIEHFA